MYEKDKLKECDHIWQEFTRWDDLEYDVHEALYRPCIVIEEHCSKCGDMKVHREYHE